MTKSLPTGCIKDNSDLSWKTFNRLLESVSLEDRIGRLYIVDIEFDTKMLVRKYSPTMKSFHLLLKNKK